MAQHFSIKNSQRKDLQKIYESICNKFTKGVVAVTSSLKFQKILYEDFKESENDMVFITWRNLRNEKETFEVHFDTKTKEVTEIYLVK